MKIDLGSISGTDVLKDIAIVVLLVIIFFQQTCDSRKSPPTGGDTGIKYIYDTIAIPSQPQQPQISYIDTSTPMGRIHTTDSIKTYTIYITQKLTRQDTEQIVNTYLKAYFYTQNFTDEKYKAHFSTVVTHDSLFKPQLTVQWLAPVQTITSAPAPSEKLKLFLGLHVGINPSQFNFGPELSLLTKNDHLYAISNDLALKQPNIEVHVGWKLHL